MCTDGDVANSARRSLAVVPDVQHGQFNGLVKDHVDSVDLLTNTNQPLMLLTTITLLQLLLLLLLLLLLRVTLFIVLWS